MARYIPTQDGTGIVDASAEAREARVMSIRTAEGLLQHYRQYAWNEAARQPPNGYVANLFLSWSNSLADALTYAAELRAKSAQAARTAELGEIGRAAA